MKIQQHSANHSTSKILMNLKTDGPDMKENSMKILKKVQELYIFQTEKNTPESSHKIW